MYKTRFFSAVSTEELQEKVNEWLEKERRIFVVGSNISSLPGAAGGEYAFYIIYEMLKGLDETKEEIISDQKMDMDPLNKIDLNLL